MIIDENGFPKTSSFAATSRYTAIDQAVLDRPDGTRSVYLKRRFIPGPERFETLVEHTVIQDERLDNLAFQYLGDPEQFWRICDANGAMEPEELTREIGAVLRIALPEGIPGPSRA
jgi:hypothetical protein